MLGQRQVPIRQLPEGLFVVRTGQSNQLGVAVRVHAVRYTPYLVVGKTGL